MFGYSQSLRRVACPLTMISGRSQGTSISADSLATIVFNRFACVVPCRYADYYICRDPFAIRLHGIEGQNLGKMGAGNAIEGRDSRV